MSCVNCSMSCEYLPKKKTEISPAFPFPAASTKILIIKTILVIIMKNDDTKDNFSDNNEKR